MKTYKVSLMPDAIKDLLDIYEYISEKSGIPDVAMAYIQKLRSKCRQQEIAPIRGTRRDDLRDNLRIVAIDKNAVIAFEVNEQEAIVTIFDVFYGGKDYDTIMNDTQKD